MSDIPTASPIVAGSTRPSVPLKWLYDNNAVLPIPDATFTGKMQLIGVGGTAPISLTVGNFSITSASLGEMTYSFTATETVTPGIWLVQITMTLSGQTYIKQFYQPILRALV